MRWVHPIFLGSAATEQKSVHSMTSDLRLLSMQRSTASTALVSTFNRRHPSDQEKWDAPPRDNKFVISKNFLKFHKISIYISF